MVRASANEWTLLKDEFAALRQDEPAEGSVEVLLDDQIRRRVGEYIMRAALPEYKGRSVLPWPGNHKQ